jgi:uncharacterized protein (DUF2249 family)
MVAHHAHMTAELQEMVSTLLSVASSGEPFAAARDAVSNFAAFELVPHALAEEDVIYKAGSEVAVLAPLVAGMIMEHVALVGLAADVPKATDGVLAASTAAALFALFKAHVAKENDLLLPGLMANGTDPAKLLADMEHAFGLRQAAARAAGGSPGSEMVVDTRIDTGSSCVQLTNEAISTIDVGTSFVLVADHDPVGIRYMLEAEQPGVTAWDWLKNGPEEWRARISKVAAPA